MKFVSHELLVLVGAMLIILIGCSDPSNSTSSTISASTESDSGDAAPYSTSINNTVKITGKLLGVNGQPMRHSKLSLKRLQSHSQHTEQLIAVANDGSFHFNWDADQHYKVTFSGVAHQPISYILTQQSTTDSDQLPTELQLIIQLDHRPLVTAPTHPSIVFYSTAQQAEQDQSVIQSQEQDSRQLLAVGLNHFQAKWHLPAGDVFYQVAGVTQDGELVADPNNKAVDSQQGWLSHIQHGGGELVIDYHHHVSEHYLSKDPLRLQGVWGRQKAALLLQQDFNRILVQQRIAATAATTELTAYADGMARSKAWRDQTRNSLDAEMVLIMSTAIKGTEPEIHHDALQSWSGQSPWLYLAEVDYCDMMSQAALVEPTEQGLSSNSSYLLTDYYLKHQAQFADYLRYFADDQAKSRCVAILAYQFKSQQIPGKSNYRKLYRLLQERYSHVPSYSFYQQMLAPPAVVVGENAPSFLIAALQDGDTWYDNEFFAGKVLLIDFWATWCTPCLREMPDLHQVYQQYNPQGFEILSVSADETLSDVTEFIQGKWRMPWQHGFLDNGEHAMVQDYGVKGYPAAFLVDAQGIVIATGEAVRGKHLHQTLATVFNKTP